MITIILKNKKISIIFSFLFTLIMLYLFLCIYESRPNNITNFSENWEYKLNGTLISSNFNTQTKFDKLKKGDIIELKNVFPNINYKDNTLEIDLSYTSIELYIENQLIYSNGVEKIKDDIMLVDGIRRIPLINDISNKEIYIKMIVGENNAISSIKEINISNENTLLSYYIKDNLLTILVGCFLLVISICLYIIIILMYNKEVYNKLLFYITSFMFGISLWLITHDGILLIIESDNIIIKYIEYIGLYSAPISIIGYLNNIENSKLNNKLNKNILKVFYIYFILFLIVTLFLHSFNIVHFKQTLKLFHISIIIFGIFLLIGIILALKNKKFTNKSFFISFAILILFVCFEIFSMNTKLKLPIFIEFYFKNATLLGVMILLVTLINNYYKLIKFTFTENSKNELLKEIAYIDSLTGLKNRNWYEQYIVNLKGTYAMISMDLNNLKQTNDELGHDEGDELLKNFANILKKSFENCNLIRFGGDEFLIIMKNDDTLINKNIKNMHNFIYENNLKNKIKISVSYGIAHKREKHNSTPTEIYKLADKRMYKMKKNYKKNLTKKQ